MREPSVNGPETMSQDRVQTRIARADHRRLGLYSRTEFDNVSWTPCKHVIRAVEFSLGRDGYNIELPRTCAGECMQSHSVRVWCKRASSGSKKSQRTDTKLRASRGLWRSVEPVAPEAWLVLGSSGWSAVTVLIRPSTQCHAARQALHGAAMAQFEWVLMN